MAHVVKMADDNALALRSSTVLQAALRFRPSCSAVDVGGLLELQRWSPQSTLRFKRGDSGNAVLSAAAKVLAQLRLLEDALAAVNVTIPGNLVSLERPARGAASPMTPATEDIPVRGITITAPGGPSPLVAPASPTDVPSRTPVDRGNASASAAGGAPLAQGRSRL